MITRELIDNYVDEYFPDEEILIADGFEEAFLGIAFQFNKYIAVFDKQKCIDILCRNMSYEEAIEYFSFNVEGAYVGENTPAFLNLLSQEKESKVITKHIAEQFELPLK